MVKAQSNQWEKLERGKKRNQVTRKNVKQAYEKQLTKACYKRLTEPTCTGGGVGDSNESRGGGGLRETEEQVKTNVQWKKLN